VKSADKYYSKTGKDALGKGGFPIFQLDWEMSTNGGTNWLAVGSTRHTVYVTLKAPEGIWWNETLFYIGCRYATNETDEKEMIKKVWNHFKGLEVKRMDGMTLTYYKKWNNRVSDTVGLLEQGDGECGAWAKFFLDVLKVQGFRTLGNLLKFTPVNLDHGFIVKNWKFHGSGKSGHPSYPYHGTSSS